MVDDRQMYGLYDSDGQVMCVGTAYDLAKCMNVAVERIWRLCRVGTVCRGELKGYRVEKIDWDEET